jgi:hypothetical protein
MTTGAHSCKICEQSVHAICSSRDGEEGYVSEAICILCTKSQNAINSRNLCFERLKIEANKILSTRV